MQNYLSVMSRWLLCSWWLFALGVIGRDQDPEVVAHHTPADPVLYAIEAAITTARQAITPFHHTDSALTSGAHSLAAAKPGLMLLRALFGRELSNRGYTNSFDAGVLGGALVGMGPKAAISSKQMRRAPEDPLVRL